MIGAFLTALFFALSAICATRSIRVYGGIPANFWRLVFAALVLAIYAHGWGYGLRGESLPFFLLSGVIGFGVGDLAFFQALPRLGSRLTVLLTQCLAAPLAAVTEWIWLGTTLNSLQWLSSATILSGVALAMSPAPPAPAPRAGTDTRAPRRSPYWISGLAFGVLAALGQGLGAVLSRKAFAVAALAGQPVDGITAAYQRVLGGIALAGLSMLWLQLHRVRTVTEVGKTVVRVSGAGPRPATSWHWILLNGLAGPVMGVSCFQWALQTTPAGIVLPIVSTTPLVVIPFAYYLEADRFTARSLAGCLLAVLGAVLLAMTR